ncbi:hypothetical protein JZ751_019462 [Albula glossodonta]|uniref:Uncharacterized protein n=1 Tax=Albula glossodonta TaxID=121402 RepID=A0A8T2NP03_9TELE|nr:hypothetical protein JZ751_019462 [Albula glossodonta]
MDGDLQRAHKMQRTWCQDNIKNILPEVVNTWHSIYRKDSVLHLCLRAWHPTYLLEGRYLKQTFPATLDAENYLWFSSTASFEVTVNDKLIFSKLKAGAFPDNQEVVEMVKRASKGETVEKVKKKKETCVAM